MEDPWQGADTRGRVSLPKNGALRARGIRVGTSGPLVRLEDTQPPASATPELALSESTARRWDHAKEPMANLRGFPPIPP